ncbi:MAG: hypothetical protein RLZZ08_1049 [Pseudomonadota bacterium]
MERADRPLLALVAGYFLLATVIGGGGTPNPATEVPLILLSFLFATVALFLRPPTLFASFASNRVLWLCALGILAVPLAQLIPLPPSIWRALPGRTVVTGILDFAGTGSQWRPLSLVPAATLASLLCLIAPAIMAYSVVQFGPTARAWLLGAVAAMALLTAVIGVLQFVAGNGGLKLYNQTALRFATGFFANRNTLPDFLTVGGFATLATLQGRREEAAGIHWSRDAATGAALTILAMGTLASGSRAGIALFSIVLLSAAYLFGRRSRSWTLAAVLVLPAFYLVGWAAVNTGALADVGGRLEKSDASRLVIWRNTLDLIPAYLPFGSGMGTFVPVYQTIEPLDDLQAAVTNRAHNDYLELALESGVAGMAVLALTVATVLAYGTRKILAGGSSTIEGWFALGTLLVIALHSAVDYPLRNMTMLAVGGLAFGLLTQARGGPAGALANQHSNAGVTR